jgi:hypothetical protein
MCKERASCLTGRDEVGAGGGEGDFGDAVRGEFGVLPQVGDGEPVEQGAVGEREVVWGGGSEVSLADAGLDDLGEVLAPGADQVVEELAGLIAVRCLGSIHMIQLGSARHGQVAAGITKVRIRPTHSWSAR